LSEPTAESWLHATKALIRERSDQAFKDFRLAVRPIYALYGPGPNPRLQHWGTGVLLRIDGCAIMATAAHVLDPISSGIPMFISGPVGTHPVEIRGRIKATPLPPGGRDRDHLDSAFWTMPDAVVAALGGVRFVESWRISQNRASIESRYYMAMGYAISRNKGAIDHATGGIGNLISRYSGSVIEIPALAAELGVTGANHMFLSFDKRAQSEDDAPVDTFGPRGLSGGPLLDLGDFVSEAAYAADSTHQASLCGILIAHKKKHKAMVALKIGPIVAGIKKYLQTRSAR
jgi:hypothetical protein